MCRRERLVGGTNYTTSNDEFYFFFWEVEVAHISGKGHCVLLAERLILNVMARCSGVATRAERIQKSLNQVGWNGSLAGSRKTTPGFRLVEKYGLLVAKVDPHRYDLGSMVGHWHTVCWKIIFPEIEIFCFKVMLKDNHITISGSIKNAIEKVKCVSGMSTKIEVECRNIAEAVEAATASVDIIMLDNFVPSVS